MRNHEVTVRIGSKTIERWTEYTIDSDMLTLADQFSMVLHAARPDVAREVWQLCKPDGEVQVMVDGTVIVSGFIDSRRRKVDRGESSISIRGRDRGGRVVDESMELRNLDGLEVDKAIAEVVKPWYPQVVLSNTTNRQKLRGNVAAKGRVGIQGMNEDGEATTEDTLGKGQKVQPGQTRAQVMAALLAQVGLMGWGAADGKTFVVGLPVYDQAPLYRFFLPASANSDRVREGNVLGWEYEEDLGERYSEITVLGSAYMPDDADEALRIKATVKNGPGAFGVGKDFQRRKTLIVADDDVKSIKQANVRARREMAERDGQGTKLTIRVAGHGQVLRDRMALYAFDTPALVEDEELQIKGTYQITGLQFSGKGDDETTTIHLVPRGTVLRV